MMRTVHGTDFLEPWTSSPELAHVDPYTPETILVQLAMTGDRVAQGELVRRIRPFACNQAKKALRRTGARHGTRVRNMLVLDELVGAGMVGAFHASTRYSPARAKGKGWQTYVLTAVACEVSREAERQIRAAKKYITGARSDRSLAPDAAAVEAGLQFREEVRAAVDQLPRRQRFLIRHTLGLCCRKPLTLPRAAARLGITMRRAKLDRRNARRALAELLAYLAPDPPA